MSVFTPLVITLKKLIHLILIHLLFCSTLVASSDFIELGIQDRKNNFLKLKIAFPPQEDKQKLQAYFDDCNIVKVFDQNPTLSPVSISTLENRDTSEIRSAHFLWLYHN